MASYEELALRFKALAHPVRLQILDLLRRGEVCVCHMETALGRRQAYISQQLMVLREAGLVEARKEGLQMYYRLTDEFTAGLLDTIFGEAPVQAQPRLADCSCPHCVAVAQETS
ncbi:MAG: metalloregulator ArsR/SmtB family transcription factor [Anaerolineae bacterium]